MVDPHIARGTSTQEEKMNDLMPSENGFFLSPIMIQLAIIQEKGSLTFVPSAKADATKRFFLKVLTSGQTIKIHMRWRHDNL